MKSTRLLPAILAVFATVWIGDFLVHGIWLRPDYIATARAWRDEADMRAHMPWLAFAQFLWSVVFVQLWAKGFAHRECIRCALIYGLMMGLFFQTNTLVLYSVQPLPGVLMAKWFAANLIEAVLAGVVVFFVYKPSKNPA